LFLISVHIFLDQFLLLKISHTKTLQPSSHVNEFSFQLDVKFSQEEVRPGNNVDILVTPDCGRTSRNYVALAAVDQSVLLLSEGNTVTKTMFNDNLQQFNTYGNYPTLPKLTDRPYSLSYYPSYSQMVDAGVIVFTNANTYKLERGYSSYNYYGGGPGGPGGRVLARKASAAKSFSTPMADRAESASNDVASAPGDSVRRDFPETWIWEDINYNCRDINDADYVDKITKKAPDTITSWVLTAFSNNLETGFATMDAPKTLRVFKPFFASLTLPYSILRGEILQLSVQVFNYLATASKITVTLENKNSEFRFMAGDEEDGKRRLFIT
jgi:CD109 antigen